MTEADRRDVVTPDLSPTSNLKRNGMASGGPRGTLPNSLANPHL